MGTTNCKPEINMKIGLLSALVCEICNQVQQMDIATLADVRMFYASQGASKFMPAVAWIAVMDI